MTAENADFPALPIAAAPARESARAPLPRGRLFRKYVLFFVGLVAVALLVNSGFDFWFGYLCQREAHRYYPDHLWRNGDKVILSQNENGGRGQYAHDLIAGEALKFLRDSAAGAKAGNPFFLYVAFTTPHVDLDALED